MKARTHIAIRLPWLSKPVPGCCWSKTAHVTNDSDLVTCNRCITLVQRQLNKQFRGQLRAAVQR